MNSLLDGVIFEDQCINCGCPRISSDIPLCRKCAAMLRPSVNSFNDTEGNRIYYMCKYNDISGKLIKSFKYNACIESGIFMSAIMSTGLETIGTDCLITYIPFDRFKKYNRFYNHAEILAQTVAYITGLKSRNILRKGISIVSQARLPSFLRQKRHIKFTAESTDKMNIIVIDDVVTSGSTMRWAIRAIKSANPYAEISGLCFAGH